MVKQADLYLKTSFTLNRNGRWYREVIANDYTIMSVDGEYCRVKGRARHDLKCEKILSHEMTNWAKFEQSYWANQGGLHRT